MVKRHTQEIVNLPSLAAHVGSNPICPTLFQRVSLLNLVLDASEPFTHVNPKTTEKESMEGGPGVATRSHPHILIRMIMKDKQRKEAWQDFWEPLTG